MKIKNSFLSQDIPLAGEWEANASHQEAASFWCSHQLQGWTAPARRTACRSEGKSWGRGPWLLGLLSEAAWKHPQLHEEIQRKRWNQWHGCYEYILFHWALLPGVQACGVVWNRESSSGRWTGLTRAETCPGDLSGWRTMVSTKTLWGWSAGVSTPGARDPLTCTGCLQQGPGFN